MSEAKFINPSDLVNKSIPPEILEQLKVLGRVEFQPKPTVTSAVSTAGTKEDIDTAEENSNISGLIDHVAEMEDIVSQMEDMIDDLTKDMSIPVGDNKSVADAVKALGGSDNITKDIFDKAQALVDNAPILLTGRDYFIDALAGNGKIEGAYLDCDQVLKSVASTWNTAPANKYTPEQPIIDETAKIADEYEQNLGKMVIEILQSFFFNMLWPKYLVDLAIINPTRIIVAYPLDGMIGFFMTKRFRVKDKKWMETNGPVNKLLNKIRCTLLCVPPAKMWDLKKYKPIVDISKCQPCEKEGNPCPSDNRTTAEVKEGESKLKGMSNIVDNIFPSNPACIDSASIMGQADVSKPTGIGVPPECLKHAKVILEAVVADALSPTDPSKAGIAGTKSISSVIKEQVQGL